MRKKNRKQKNGQKWCEVAYLIILTNFNFRAFGTKTQTTPTTCIEDTADIYRRNDADDIIKR